MMSPVCRKTWLNNQYVFRFFEPLLLFFIVLVGTLLVIPRMGVSATVNYNSNYKDVIGNATFLNGPIVTCPQKTGPPKKLV